MKDSVKILSLILLLASCSTDVNKDEGSAAAIHEKDVTESPGHKFLFVNKTPAKTEINRWQQIQFTDVTLLVEEIEMGWSDMYGTDNDSVYSTTSDTAYFDLWPGEWFYDKAFKVVQSEFDQITLYEKITFNMAINSDGSIVTDDVPICVMSHWKTFESKWSKIKMDQGNFRFKSNENNINPVIDYTVEEFKAAVKEHCGEDWYNEIKHIKSMDKLRSELFTSYYTFKIVLRNSTTGKSIKKFIVFNAPTSC